MSKRISLKEAVKFHGHLGPYLVLGILAGELAAKKLKFKKHFGLEIRAWGASQKPKSCLVDGLQLATGATYGKGNIEKFDGSEIKIEFSNRADNKKITLTLSDPLAASLGAAKTHKDCEALARKLYKEKNDGAFRIRYL